MSEKWYDCSCHVDYPNISHRHKNGKWKCVDYMVNIDNASSSDYKHCTHCKRKWGYGARGRMLSEVELMCELMCGGVEE